MRIIVQTELIVITEIELNMLYGSAYNYPNRIIEKPVVIYVRKMPIQIEFTVI
jgi:hypothetical protein